MKNNHGHISPARRIVINNFSLIIPLIIYVVPGIAVYSLIAHEQQLIRYISIALSPFLFATGFVVTAGLISYPFHSGIINGKFPRDPGHVIYSKRKVYGTCWTTVFYCKPVYYLLLHSKPLKKLMFRLFGYKGEMNFTLYPDVWIRDLCVLNIGKNAYLSNRCTIGTNICHINTTITVSGITIGENSIVGHLAMIAPGVTIGKNSEVGVGCAVGIKVEIGDGTTMAPDCDINHYAKLGNNVYVGAQSYIGSAARIADGIKLPACSMIPEKAIIETQAQVSRYLSSASRSEMIA